MVVLDQYDVVIELNPAARRWLGESVMGIPWRDVERFHLVAASASDEWLIADGETQRRVSVTAGSRGEDSGRILLLTDITQAHEMQRQLERHKRLSAMGEMAAGLAHQLRTPLASAILYAGNLNRQVLGESDRRKFAAKALERMRALERMIQDMLLFVRGVPSLDEPIDMKLLLQDAAQVVEPQMVQRGLELRTLLPARTHALRGNGKALAGVVVNLLENAVQACSSGARIELECGGDDEGLFVSVTDNGPGMEVSVQDRLFEPFFTTRDEGTGLGLAIVQSVMQAHGGRVEVESAPGRGSRFTLRFAAVAEALQP